VIKDWRPLRQPHACIATARFESGINLKTAQAISIPPMLLPARTM
jgi:hypothetical protein